MRQITLTVLLAVVAVTPLAAKNDGDDANAQRLFKNMEAKLETAKTLSLSFDGKFETDSLPFKGWTLKGTVAVKDKQSRAEISGGKPGNEPFKALTVSDGTQVVEIQESNRKTRPASKVSIPNLLTLVERPGFMLMITPLPPEPFANSDFDLKDGFTVSGFKLGPKEQIGARETQRVDYTLSVKGNSGTFPVSVWIDSKTSLPVKRQMGTDAENVWYSETYDVTLDGKVDPKTFELPK
jgi:outer membrane lipoprotein-sorting protein